MELGEFENDSLINKILRKTFRIPLKEGGDSVVVIAGVTHPLIDLSHNGICCCLEAGETLDSAGLLFGCKLHLQGMDITGLTGKVIHCSLGKDNRLVCGIQWVKMDPEIEKKIESIVDSFRKKMFQ